jgi:hypothetical protein
MKRSHDELRQDSRRSFIKQAAAFGSVAATIGKSPLIAFNYMALQPDGFVRGQEKKRIGK